MSEKVPKQSLKCAQKKVHIPSHPLFPALIPSFTISPPFLGTLYRNGRVLQKAKCPLQEIPLEQGIPKLGTLRLPLGWALIFATLLYVTLHIT
jgi:hypothetical protein